MSDDVVIPVEEAVSTEEAGLSLPKKFELEGGIRKLNKPALEDKYNELLSAYGECCHLYRGVFSAPHQFVPVGKFPSQLENVPFNALRVLFGDLLGAYNQVYDSLESLNQIEEPYELRFSEKFSVAEESQEPEKPKSRRSRNIDMFRQRVDAPPKPVPAILPAPDPSLGGPYIPEDSGEELIDLGSAIEELLRDVVLNYGGSLDSLQILANCFAVAVFEPTFKKPIRVQIPGLTLKITPGGKSYFFRVTGDHEEISIKIKKRPIQLEADTSLNSDSEDSEA